MIQTGFESRVKVQQIIESQLPSFILEENPNASEFLKQYYVSQEYQGGPVDIAENLDQYLKLDNLTPEVVVDSTILSSDVSLSDTSISVSSIKGFPKSYGLLKIDDEIITYTGITGNTFTGCIRGFSGITNYHQDLNQEELTFSSSSATEHSSGSTVQNLSSLFLKEFYQKLKYTIAPGLEKTEFTSELDVGNFLSQANSFYKAKGTDDSFRILFNVLYNETPKVINLEEYLIKPSSAEYIRNEVIIVEVISGLNPKNLVGQTIVKSTDSSTNASVSSIEPFNKNNRQYYKISLFVGSEESSSILGNFTITPNTKTVLESPVSSAIITVDSTIGFPENGELVCGNNTVSYTSKSVNQFLGCSGISENIEKNSLIRNNDTYFGYENGDITKKVEFRILGVLSNFKPSSKNINVSEGDVITIKNVGDLIKNPEIKTQKEIFANSWIYNTSTRYEVSTIGSNYVLSSDIDRSSLKIGDRVELLERGTEILAPASNDPRITQIISNNTIKIDGGSFSTESGKEYDLRRKINTASSSGVSIEYGNNLITSDVQNLYSDGENYAYVASNSLPASALNNQYNYRYNISANIKTASISSVNNLFNKNENDEYDTIGFSDSAPFITGDRIYYQPTSTPLVGLETGDYYVEVLPSNNKRIKLYSSPAFVGVTPLKFKVPESGLDTQSFTLYSQRSGQIGVQKILKKFPLQSRIKSSGIETIPGVTGMLINGVEISNYKSLDKIYYGPLDSIDVLNGGKNYDVINPPVISISSGSSNALAQPVVTGSISDVYIDSQDYDINKILSVDISGGNGSGAILEPIVTKRVRELNFDGRTIETGGGISTTGNRISFSTDHNLNNGEQVVYNSNGNSQVAIGYSSLTLINNSSYFVRVENNTTVSLFESLGDYNNNTNVIGFSTGTQGIHKFRTIIPKNTISEVKVLDGGSGYTNRKLIVKTSGISTTTNSINYENHGFNTGELIIYDYETSAISGLSTSNQYYVLKIDDDSFRLCDAGIGGTNTSSYDRGKYEVFTNTGSGYQYFSYPPISVSIKYNPVGFSTNTQFYQEIVTTPVVKGSIEQVYLYENGTGYGSTVLNYQDNPTITIKNGKNAILIPIVSNGQIISVDIQYSGKEYYSTPDLIVIDSSGTGIGAKLRPIIVNQKIVDVKIINGGIGYSKTSTSILVESSGINALLKPKIRELTVNESLRFGNEILQESDNKLKYTVSGYFDNLRTLFNESSGSHSGIIGWAYDGNPIYGPYGYSDPKNSSLSGTRIISGYVLDTSYTDRPSVSEFAEGFFVEDYKFTGSGSTLDKSNGRFCKTPEFPNGVYAYFATIDASGTPQFPYFIGNEYKSQTLSENTTLNQSFDFSSSTLLRNTFPYKVADKNASYDFISEIDDVTKQRINVESVTQGNIEKLKVVNSGSNYKINDVVKFNNSNTFGGGVSASVSSVKGKDITNVETEVTTYEGAIFTWIDGETVKVSILPNHTLNDNDLVTISGLSTDISSLNGIHKINVDLKSSVAISSIPSVASIGGTEIYVTRIPDGISIGSSIGIGTETLKVLELFRNKNIIRVERGLLNVSHDENAIVTFKPDSFTFKQSIGSFNSKLNNKVFFNPTESVGFGTTSGISYLTTLDFGDELGIQRGIPTKSIHIKDHPFKNNQSVVYTANGTTLSVSTDGLLPYNLPTNLLIVNKGKDFIGLKTTIDSDDLFFHSGGSNNDAYSLESTYQQIAGKIEKIKTTVSVSTSHGMSVGDVVNLTVNPNLSVGIGTSIDVRISRDEDRILVNPVGFNSTGINTVTNTITLANHELETGDKVYYSADLVASGLSTGDFYVFRVDSNNIKLCQTYADAVKIDPTVVSIAGTGGSSQSISLINPKISLAKNNNLVFDLSDSSLSSYNFRIYRDNNFKDEFISTGSTDSFSVSSVGTIGVSANASLTINYDSTLPEKLYYSLEKTGFISTADKDVKNYSEILFVDSVYNGNHNIVSVGTTTFDLILDRAPEKLSYIPDECDNLNYTTLSTDATGGIDKLKIISGGYGYKKLPIIEDVISTNGKDAYVLAESDSIGNTKQLRIVNEEFEYSFDSTLRPTAFVSPNIIVSNSNTLESVFVENGGSGYTQSPDVIIVNTKTGEKINSGILNAPIIGESIQSIEIVNNPKGLPENSVKIITTNNTNGLSIQKVESSSTGIFTCFIPVPPLGYKVFPFAPGDKVFVEGIEKVSSDGTGFNSEDYGYNFFVVDSYIEATPYDKVVFDLSSADNSGLTTNTGIAKTALDGFGSLIHFDNYPTFEVNQKRLDFIIGERLISEQVERDLFVSNYDGTTLKVSGTYEVSVGEIVVGKESGTIATVDQLQINRGTFDVGYSIPKNIGWTDEIGKLSSDNQVTPNNDYYQNLSYSIKSSKEYKEVEKSIKPLLHTSGLKDFADTGITSTSDASDLGGIDQTTVVIDYIDDLRVDTIYDFDFVKDIDIDTNGRSKYLKLLNTKLTDYTENIGNDVLAIDNISNQFSNSDDEPTTTLNLLKLDSSSSFESLLVRVTSLDKSESQFSEIVILNDGNNSFLVENGGVVNRDGEQYGDFSIEIDEFNDSYLTFVPEDSYNIDYDVKTIRNTFEGSVSGIGTTSIGFIDLVSSTGSAVSGATESIVSFNNSEFESLYANVQIIDEVSNDMNFVELYVTSDGSNTYISEYYFDSESETSNLSNNFIGSFGANLSGGVLSLNYTNTSPNNNTFRAKVVGFGTTATGIGTYRFKLDRQPPGNERSAIYKSDFSVGIGTTTIVSLDKTLFDSVKSLVEVSIGSTKSVHQIMMLQNNSNIYLQQSPILSVSDTEIFDTAIGMGTFGGNNSGSNLEIVFYPDSEYSSENTVISAFSQCFYNDLDTQNTPPTLNYGNIEESIDLQFYNAPNGDRVNKTNFQLTSEGVPIFVKVFDPEDTNTLISTTGTFNIKNHFFKNGEELIYTPKSTIVGIASTAMIYNDPVSGVTDTLPSTVFAVVTNRNYDQFQISTTKSGTAVTFTNFGEGNAHQFEVLKKNEKSIIAIDNLIQHPLIFTNISHTLSGSIGTETTIFNLSGISSINSSDILKIDEEYVRVNNVGLGTSSTGPITNTGSFNLVQTDRGFVGTSATSHTSSTQVSIYRGAFNIVENEIHFVDAPRGNRTIEKTKNNLDYETSQFNGRVFLRSIYTTNKIYDDLSNEFNGIGRTFTLKVGGADTTGIGTIGGSGIVLINGIFQQPTTPNNPNGNFTILEDTNAGISTIVFSGITVPQSDPLEYITSDSDVNQNETPRGGIIVSLGSTPGLGFAPLVGASVTAVVGAGGSIAGITTEIPGGSYGSGYNGLTSIGVTVYDSTQDAGGDPASITAVVGAGGSLSFSIGAGGTGYNNPQIFVAQPTYENLSVIGVSRLGVGATTTTGIGLSISLKVGSVDSTGIGSTYFGVTDFDISKSGYSFQRGDVFKPVGLVTDSRLASPINEFELTVLETYSDKFAAWEFGELDFIDSISSYQDGVRKTFPLFYNNELISFEKESDSRINLQNCLLIFINGVLQEPGVNYTFGGGTSFIFTTAPKPEDKISIYFYKGSAADFNIFTDINETIKKGDVVQVLKSNDYPNIPSQNKRTVTDLSFSDKFETTLYSGPGITETYRPLSWIKQKTDKNINGEVVSKARDSIESQVFPVANIIGDLSTIDTEVFVDSSELFGYEDPDLSSFDCLIVGGISTAAISTTTGNESIELIKNFTTIQGESGSVVGIASTTTPNLAIEFTLDSLVGTQLQVGYPIYIFDTLVGSGVTSINSSDSEVVGIGTEYVDNIYYVESLNTTSGIITCRVHSGSDISGINTTGTSDYPVGRYSWGRLSNTSGLQRSSNPISIGVTGNIVSGLSTYPIIQRRNVGLRFTGALPKLL
jgi:hypothetical protein